MNTAGKAGVMKSWVCIVALTFFVPAGATQLSHLLVAAVTQTGDKTHSLQADSVVASDQTASDCGDSAAELTL